MALTHAADVTSPRNSLSGNLCIRPDPIGSHLFPEDVILEEACEHLERIWDSQWQGEATNAGQEEVAQTSETAEKIPIEAKSGGVPQFLRNLGQKLRTFSKRKSTSQPNPEVEGRVDSTMTFRVPRYPSWVKWEEEKP